MTNRKPIICLVLTPAVGAGSTTHTYLCLHTILLACCAVLNALCDAGTDVCIVNITAVLYVVPSSKLVRVSVSSF